MISIFENFYVQILQIQQHALLTFSANVNEESYLPPIGLEAAIILHRA